MSNVRMSIDVSRELHQIIKLLSSLKSETIRDYVVEAITEKIRNEYKVNEAAVKTLIYTDDGLALNLYDDLEELYKKLDA